MTLSSDPSNPPPPKKSGISAEEAAAQLKYRQEIKDKVRAYEEQKAQEALTTPPPPKPVPFRLIKLITRCGCERVMEGPVQGDTIQLPMIRTVLAGQPDVTPSSPSLAVRTFRYTGQIEGICAVFKETE